MFHFFQGMTVAMQILTRALHVGAVALMMAQGVAAQSTTAGQPSAPATLPQPPALIAPEVLAERFPACVGQLQNRALSAGISENTVRQVLAQVQFNPRVIELDRKQPEFTESFTNYFNRRVTQQRIERGRELFAQHRELLYRISREYGIQPQYLLAFWGLETNFGSFFGNIPVLDSLATLACDERRSEFFTGELLGALKILDTGDVQPSRMIGSWAGAMGHTQFMPSVFLRYALDADNDGRRDLWGSIPDALSSAANFLKGLGWKEGERWGREVRLPKGFAYEEAGLDKARSLAEWSRLGVKSTNGGALPNEDMKAALVIPAGHQGPAFLVYDNFRVIMRWNRSEFYAISVGMLADQIAGRNGLVRQPPADALRLSREQALALQTRLQEKGFDAGSPDGIIGSATKNAIRQFQKAQGMIADGYPDKAVFAALGIELIDP